MFLTAEEIAELTARTQRRAQRRVLNFMGIEHKVRPDGSLVVARAHVEKQLGASLPAAKMKDVEPDWGAINAA